MRSWPTLRQYPWFGQDDLIWATINLSQYRRYFGRDSKQTPFQCKPETLPFGKRSVFNYFVQCLIFVCFLLGNPPASELYMPTFRNTLFPLHRQVGVEWLGLRNVGLFIREEIWLENSLNQKFSHINTRTFLKPSHSTPTYLWRGNRVFRNVGI